mmetsp:Transcript_6986/g.18774  ORF Transcript_6986/g.18774 Transcript_6986/m.18774 type:complete len:226 (-) Transcript_6986:776-1453(-)
MVPGWRERQNSLHWDLRHRLMPQWLVGWKSWLGCGYSELAGGQGWQCQLHWHGCRAKGQQLPQEQGKGGGHQDQQGGGSTLHAGLRQRCEQLMQLHGRDADDGAERQCPTAAGQSRCAGGSSSAMGAWGLDLQPQAHCPLLHGSRWLSPALHAPSQAPAVGPQAHGCCASWAAAQVLRHSCRQSRSCFRQDSSAALCAAAAAAPTDEGHPLHKPWLEEVELGKGQ